MALADKLKKVAGLELFGVADTASYEKKAPLGHRPSEFMRDARSIVVMGTRLLDSPLDGIPETRKEYTANFHTINTRLNDRLFHAAAYLQEEGHKVFPVPYLEMPGWNLEKRPAVFLNLLRHLIKIPRVHDLVNNALWENLSFRHMAAEAGLGELGVNNLLLTPEHGPRVRFVALLTDAGLPAGKPLEEALCQPERCGYACVKACPVGALSEDGSATDKATCLRYYIKLGLPGMSGVRCGLCVASCPVYRPRFRAGEE